MRELCILKMTIVQRVYRQSLSVGIELQVKLRIDYCGLGPFSSTPSNLMISMQKNTSENWPRISKIDLFLAFFGRRCVT